MALPMRERERENASDAAVNQRSPGASSPNRVGARCFDRLQPARHGYVMHRVRFTIYTRRPLKESTTPRLTPVTMPAREKERKRESRAEHARREKKGGEYVARSTPHRRVRTSYLALSSSPILWTRRSLSFFFTSQRGVRRSWSEMGI